MNLTSTTIVDSSLPVPATVPAVMPVPVPNQRPIRKHAMAAALKRLAESAGYTRGGYDGAASNRLNRDWLTRHYSGDAAAAAAGDMLLQRARDLVRNEGRVALVRQRIVENVVGADGIQAEAEVEADDETLDDEANRQIDGACKRWADEADAEGESHWSEMQAMAVGETVEAGDTFLVKVANPDPRRTIPLCYQLLESEQINTSLDRPMRSGENRIKRGIEFDKFGCKVAYHFWVEHPYDLQISSYDTVRVPADRIIHHYARSRPSLRRGVTWFAPVLQTLRDFSEYIGSEMTAARIASYFTVAVKRAQPGTAGLGFGDEEGNSGEDGGNSLEYLGPAVIASLGQGDQVETINPGRPNAQAGPWIELILSGLANGVGLTYLGLTGDVSKASYSSSRFARLQDKTFWRTLQGHAGRNIVLPVRREVIGQLVAYGRIPDLTPLTFRANPHRWTATRLLPPGWEEIDGQKEVAAAIERIKAGLSTLQEECAGRGHNWRRILKQRAREMALARELEVPLTVDNPAPPVWVPEPPPGQGQDQQSDENADEETA